MDFTWKDIFSDVFKPHTKEDRTKLMLRGMTGRHLSRAKMLDQWQKPWLFLPVAIAAIAISLLCLVLCSTFPAYGALVIMFVIPAIAIPLAVLVFFWEMNIPANVSFLEMLLYMLIGGILSLLITGMVRNFIEFDSVACILGPLPEELAKFAAVWLLLSRKKYNYGVQGVLIGAAVGAGFAAFETSGYAYNIFELVYDKYGDFGLGVSSLVRNQITRGLLAVGGHVIWAALYGGALGLAKGNGKMRIQMLADRLVIMTFSGAFLLHTAWNFAGGVGGGSEAFYFIDAYPPSVISFINKLNTYYLSYILITVLAWMLMLMVLRKCIRQCVWVSEKSKERHRSANQAAQRKPYAGHQEAVQGSVTVGRAGTGERVLLTVKATGALNAGRTYELREGHSLVFGRDSSRTNVTVPGDTKGVSGLHCEIKVKGGYPVLIDRNSSYGTFFSNGQKLEPNVPYKIKGAVTFYLAEPKNQFSIHLM